MDARKKAAGSAGAHKPTKTSEPVIPRSNAAAGDLTVTNSVKNSTNLSSPSNSNMPNSNGSHSNFSPLSRIRSFQNDADNASLSSLNKQLPAISQSSSEDSMNSRNSSANSAKSDERSGLAKIKSGEDTNLGLDIKSMKVPLKKPGSAVPKNKPPKAAPKNERIASAGVNKKPPGARPFSAMENPDQQGMSRRDSFARSSTFADQEQTARLSNNRTTSMQSFRSGSGRFVKNNIKKRVHESHSTMKKGGKPTESAILVKEMSMQFNFGQGESVGPTEGMQPRGVMTVNQENGNILTVNNIVQMLLGYSNEQLIGTSVTKLMGDSRSKMLMQEGLKTAQTTKSSTVIFDGTLMDLIREDGSSVSVSTWFKSVFKDGRSRFIMVIEEVERISGKMVLSLEGDVTSADANLWKLFGYPAEKTGLTLNDLVSQFQIHHIYNEIPSLPITLLADICKQPYYLETWFYATGEHASAPDSAFPIILRLLDGSGTKEFRCHLSCLPHVGGMFTLHHNGTIESGNDTLLTVMFGYHLADIINKPVLELIPDFNQVMAQAIEYYQETDSSFKRPTGDFVAMNGSYEMTCQHYDGGCFRVIVQIREIFKSANNKDSTYTLWVTQADSPVTDPSLFDTAPAVASKGISSTKKSSFVIPLGSNAEIDKHFDMGKLLGTGSYGSVNVAVSKKDGKELSIKSISKKKLIKEFCDEETQIPKEIIVMKKLSHPNIIKFIDAYESPDTYFIVMEYFTQCVDLFQFIDDHPQMEEALASKIFLQIANSVSFCHKSNVSHRDIKEENVLINGALQTRLIDFGSACICKPETAFKVFFGTLEYASPEVLSGNPYKGPENDMWALGVTLYSMIFTENPFFDVDETIAGDLHPPFQPSKGMNDYIPTNQFRLHGLDSGNAYIETGKKIYHRSSIEASMA